MQLETLHFGTIEIADDQVITLPKGLLGFEGLRRYVLIDSDDCFPFRWLQSVDTPDLALVVVNPLTFFPDYTVSVHAREVADIGVKNPNDVEILTIVTIPREMGQMSVNLQGPILINQDNKTAKQLVLTDAEYTVHHYILPELQRHADRQIEPVASAVRLL